MTVETTGDDVKTSSRSGQQFAAPPAEASNLPDIVSALRTLSELDGLTEEEYVFLSIAASRDLWPSSLAAPDGLQGSFLTPA